MFPPTSKFMPPLPSPLPLPAPTTSDTKAASLSNLVIRASATSSPVRMVFPENASTALAMTLAANSRSPFAVAFVKPLMVSAASSASLPKWPTPASASAMVTSMLFWTNP